MKKNLKEESVHQQKVDKIVQEVVRMGEQLKNLAKTAKEKFISADEKTKKKVISGLVGAAAILAAVAGIKKIKSRKKKHSGS